MVDNKNKTKTKAEMMLELESIKVLLREDDDIPILQEMIKADMHAEISNPHSATNSGVIRDTEQPDFFNQSANTDSATALLNTLNDFASIANNVAKQKDTKGQTPPSNSKKSSGRQDMIKASGENPFLPAHIRTRLHGNNPPPLFEFETARKIAKSSRPTTLLGNTQHKFIPSKPTILQQELIDELVDAMLPEIANELRKRLAAMSKEMLEILIAEKK